LASVIKHRPGIAFFKLIGDLYRPEKNGRVFAEADEDGFQQAIVLMHLGLALRC
jgi:hypothetical protein